MEAAKNLRRLDASENRIASIGVQEPLPALEYLNLNNNPLERLDGIEMFPGLTDLFLNNMRLDDLEPLAALPKLRVLGLYNTPVADYGALARIKSLKHVLVPFVNEDEGWPVRERSRIDVDVETLNRHAPWARLQDLEEYSMADAGELP
ncbi:MAG: leucine-rich repeat domain-containing protein [Candidatus Sigynarchaeota archaeon]